jgi:hypothetical protein
MKTNFRKNKDEQSSSTKNENTSNQKDLTQKEFEEFISKSGAKGSFMVYRSTKKDEELGLDEL